MNICKHWIVILPQRIDIIIFYQRVQIGNLAANLENKKVFNMLAIVIQHRKSV